MTQAIQSIPPSECGGRSVLVVDDEELFLSTLRDGFRTLPGRCTLYTACNGVAALQVLREHRVDLLVTDLRMPEMDGFTLLSHMRNEFPTIPVIVMTAFGTPDIERQMNAQHVLAVLDKPVDFASLASCVLETLEASASGRVSGITLPSLMQVVQMERKSCTLTVRSREGVGSLGFEKGDLFFAVGSGKSGDSAVLDMLAWNDPVVRIVATPIKSARNVQRPLGELLIDGYRIHDEELRQISSGEWTVAPKSSPQSEPLPDELDYIDFDLSTEPPPALRTTRQTPNRVAQSAPLPAEPNQEERKTMSAQESLEKLTQIDGFSGAAVFTPTGEDLASVRGQMTNIKDVGVLANSVLLNAQKTSLEMGTGRGQLVHIEAENAHILVRCVNEGDDPLHSQPGKGHVHVVLVLKQDASIGLAKMKLGQVAESIAPEFRG